MATHSIEQALHLKFEWDVDKEKVNITKHKLNFTDACHAFSDPFQLNLYDSWHSDDEDRWVVIGEIPVMKVVIVVHTVRLHEDGSGTVRIISARRATKKERVTYLSRRQQ